MMEYNAREFYDCPEIEDLTAIQKQYLNALIDLSPKKPKIITIDRNRNYAWFRYEGFDYPVYLAYLGKTTIDTFLSCNIPDIAYNLGIADNA